MTVFELIEELQQFDPDADVIVRVEETDYSFISYETNISQFRENVVQITGGQMVR